MFISASLFILAETILLFFLLIWISNSAFVVYSVSFGEAIAAAVAFVVKAYFFCMLRIYL